MRRLVIPLKTPVEATRSYLGVVPSPPIVGTGHGGWPEMIERSNGRAGHDDLRNMILTDLQVIS